VLSTDYCQSTHHTRLGRYVTTGSNKEGDHVTPRHNLDSISGNFLDILNPVTPLKIFTILVSDSNGSAGHNSGLQYPVSFGLGYSCSSTNSFTFLPRSVF
jgi:hypothetical protein